MTDRQVKAAARAIETIILRRLHENRIQGYTLPMSAECAEAALAAATAERVHSCPYAECNGKSDTGTTCHMAGCPVGGDL